MRSLRSSSLGEPDRMVPLAWASRNREARMTSGDMVSDVAKVGRSAFESVDV